MTLTDIPSLSCFANKAENTFPIEVLTESNFPAWLEKQPKHVKAYIKRQEIKGKAKECFNLYSRDMAPEKVVYIRRDGVTSPYDFAAVFDYIVKNIPASVLKDAVFSIEDEHYIHDDAALGWGLASYRFDKFKSRKAPATPKLVWQEGVDKKRVKAILEGIYLARNLINMPPNELGPDQMIAAAKAVAEQHDIKAKVVQGDALLQKNFPLVHAVGKAGAQDPAIIEMKWGNPDHPKIAIVGKGVTYDTGGYNLKPGASMRNMKKDMGGAAHALGLAHIIMSLKLPVQLHVVTPVVQNNISDEAMVPGDIYPSRKGLTVEIDNTDAEGRLILADALTLACEGKPDLLIDFATLTGAARVALGTEVPPVFSNDDDVATKLQNISWQVEDPLWRLPLVPAYRKDVDGGQSDIVNSSSNLAGAIMAALFLERFIEDGVKWAHIDTFAWQNGDRPGRQKGGSDLGLRSTLAFIEQEYAKK
ncbi:MAG: leucyl aminopeptidase family protein [Alphaproteobacteria bacterium]|nr:leucyl aminopeptidase family protein [Alphaproteobacteria bacterium]